MKHTPPALAADDMAPASVSFAEAFKFWLKLGFISFGGPAGQIAIMHAELVERRRWISATCSMCSTIRPACPKTFIASAWKSIRVSSTC